MEWTAEGLLIGVRRHGETSVVAEAMVAGRGRCLGLVRGGRSAKQSATLQPGNLVRLVWRARLEDHLGTFVVERLESRAAALMERRETLYLLGLVCDHLRLLPERDPHDRLLAEALALLEAGQAGERIGAALARFELHLLEELGFGLDLSTCAATGAREDLAFVSPRSGRAVSRAAGLPYAPRLLRLPRFFLDPEAPTETGDVADGLALTGYFLDHHVWHPRRIAPPPTRDALVAGVEGAKSAALPDAADRSTLAPGPQNA